MNSHTRPQVQPWQALVPLTTVLTVVVNVLATTLPIAGRTTAEISDSFPVLFTPAGYVFSIWGVIYTGLLGYAIWQTLPVQAFNPRVRAVAWPITIGNLANALWIVLWHNLWIGTSFFVIVVLLLSLMLTYLHLRPARGTANERHPVSRAERFWARGTFSVYLGWATVATVANATIALYNLGWRGGVLPEALYATAVLLVATGIGALMLRRHRDIAFVGVLVWAFLGIVVKQGDVVLVAGTAAVGAAALALLAGLVLLARARGTAAA
jgi:benzodiazapine receptor